MISINPLPGVVPGAAYDLIDFASGQAAGLGNLSLASTSVSGYAAYLQPTATAEQLVISSAGAWAGSAAVSSTGTNVTVAVPANQATGAGAIQAAFANVVSAGTLTNNYYTSTSQATAAGNLGGNAAQNINFSLAGTGNVGQFWDLTYNGSFAGSTTASFTYDPSLVGSNTGSLAIYHYTGGAWVQVPILSINGDTLTVSVSSFSPFALGTQGGLGWDPATSGGTALGGGGVWNTGTWWDGTHDTLWTSGTNDAIFNGAAGGTVTVNGTVGVRSLCFLAGGYSISGGTLAFSGGAIDTEQDASIGSVVSGNVGLTKNGAGTLTLSGTGGLNSFSSVTVNQGNLAIQGATFSSSGALSILGTNVNNTVAAGLTVSGGAQVSAASALVDGTSVYPGTLVVQGTGSLGASTLNLGNILTVGGSGSASATISNGGQLIANLLVLGQNAGSSGTCTQTGGTIESYNLLLAESTGGSGTYKLSGSGLLSAGFEFIAYSGTGSFAQTGGTNTASYSLVVGSNTGSIGTYKLSGSGLLSAVNENIGYFGTSSFAQSGGTNSVSGGLVLGVNAGCTGTYNLNGGLLALSAAGLAQGAGVATFNFGGGTLGASGPWSWSSTLNMNLSGIGGPGTVDTTGGDIGLSGVLSGSGGLAKVGPGTLTLSGSNTFKRSHVRERRRARGRRRKYALAQFRPYDQRRHARRHGICPDRQVAHDGPGRRALNLYAGNLFTATGAASLTGTLNLSGVSGAGELMAYGSESGTFGTVAGLPGGDKLVYTPTQLDVALVTATSYTLAANASAMLIHAGGSSTITATITNTGGTAADALDYTNLTVTNAGVLNGVWPKAANAAPIANNGGSDSNSGDIAATTPPGTYTFTPSVASAGNDTLGGTASLQGVTPVTVSVFSGKAQWNAVSGGTWSPDANWSDTQGSGAPGAGRVRLRRRHGHFRQRHRRHFGDRNARHPGYAQRHDLQQHGQRQLYHRQRRRPGAGRFEQLQAAEHLDPGQFR